MYLNNYLFYIYRKQWYKNLLHFNEECIFENVSLAVVNMDNGTKKVVKMKTPQKKKKSLILQISF